MFYPNNNILFRKYINIYVLCTYHMAKYYMQLYIFIVIDVYVRMWDIKLVGGLPIWAKHDCRRHQYRISNGDWQDFY